VTAVANFYFLFCGFQIHLLYFGSSVHENIMMEKKRGGGEMAGKRVKEGLHEISFQHNTAVMLME
jgi:hypothetical protein